ncbi:MAG: hypothetical protein ACYCZY_03935 [Lacisediminihabitans sp.]
MVQPPTVAELPAGYTYGVTRYADLILRDAFPERFTDFVATPINKYGQSTTHWDKLIPRVNLGGGEECPLILVGIEPPRVTGFDVVQKTFDAGEGLHQ